MNTYLMKMTGGGQSPPRAGNEEIALAWVGSCLAIAAIAALEQYTIDAMGIALLMGSFGSSAVLVFGVIRSPLAQPRNFVGGHVISALAGVSCWLLFSPTVWLAASTAVGTSIVLMHLSKTLHPPGGATALIAVVGGDAVHQLGYWFVIVPSLLGSLVMLAVALLVNNIPKNHRYPQFWW